MRSSPGHDDRRRDAEMGRGAEQELAAGKAPSTPVSLISWVGIATAVVAAVAIGIAVFAYLLA